MAQRWWLVLVAVVGVALAILLFPRPDTGDDPILVEDPTARAPSAVATARPSGTANPAIDPSRMVTGPRPDAAEVMARRATPEATYANLLVGPVSSFKFAIRKAGPQTAEVPAIEDQIDATVAELRAVRIDPAARPWSEIEASVQALLTTVTSSSYGSNPDVIRSVERANLLLEQYRTNPTGPAPVSGVTTPPPSAEDLAEEPE